MTTFGALVAAVFVLAPLAAHAQATAGVGDDATPIPARGSRIRIGGLWTSYDSRFAPSSNGDVKKLPLFSKLSRDNLGVTDMPILAETETGIRALSGLGTAYSLTLGKLEAVGDVSKSIVPFHLDIGITNRLAIGFMVPYVETRSNNRFALNRDGQGATVGQNPARPTASTARVANTLVVTQIEASRAALTAEIARCADAGATGGGCAAIRANPTAAQALLTQAASFGSLVGTVYGTATVPGSPVVPIQRSPAQTAIEAKLAELRTAFLGFESNNLDITTKPVAATIIYGSGGLQTIAQDSAFGLAYDTLANGGRAGMGDAEVTATFLLLNSFGSSQVNRLESSRKAVRLNVTGGFRFGTANGGRTGNPFDLPTGDGANALLIRSTTDLVWSRTLWVSGTVRYAKPLTDQVIARFPELSDSNLFKPSLAYLADRTLGASTEIEIAPRVGIGRSFGLSMAYTLRHQGASTLNSRTPAEFDPEKPSEPPDYATTAITVHGLQVGASYSTLNSFVRGKSRWPLEVIYSHGIVLTGSGGVVPATVSDRVELRIYTRFPRR